MKQSTPPPRDPEREEAGLRAFYSHPEREKLLEFIDTYPHWDDLIYRKFTSLDPLDLWWYIKGYVRTRKSRVHMGKYDFFFTTPSILFEKLHKIDTTVGGTLITTSLIPKWEQDRYYLRGLIDESIASSQIEGAATTKKIAEQMLRTGRKPKNKDEQMILNNFSAMQYVGKNSNKDLTKDMLLHLQSLVTKDTLENTQYTGAWRDTDDIVVADVITGEVYHTPPSHSEIEVLTNDFIDFFNHQSTEQRFIHPIVRAIILHFLIGWIHPFADGNGRTARSLFHWYTLKHGYNLMPYLSISQMILESKVQYGKAYTQTESDENDMTYFILYNIKQIEKSWIKLEQHIQWTLKKEKKLRETYLSEGMNLRQAEILSWFEKEGDLILTIQDASLRISTPRPTIRVDIEWLVKLWKLKRIPLNKKTYGYTLP